MITPKRLLVLLLCTFWCISLAAVALDTSEFTIAEANGIQISLLPVSSHLNPDETVQITVRLNAAPQGVSGYNLTVQLTNPDVAEIVGVQFPSWASLPANSTLPADAVWCKAADLAGTSGTADITLVTVTVRADAAGATNLTVIPTRVEDRQGGRYTPDVIQAQLQVGAPVQPPVANFTVNVTSGSAPLTVAFTDTSTGNPTSWSWAFGDGGSSTQQHPVHTYTAHGNYTVNLTATNAGGADTLTRTGYITVTQNPSDTNCIRILPASSSLTVRQTRSYTLALDAAPAGLSGYNLTVQLTDPAVAEIVGVQFPAWSSLPAHSTVPADSVWCKAADLAGTSGTADITLATVTVRADAAGSTNLTVIPTRVEDRQGGRYTPDVIQAQLQVDAPVQPPIANFTANITSGIAPLTVQFTDLSAGNPTSWNWTFGDGSTSTDQHPVHTYTTAGDYTVSLTATNPEGVDTVTRVGYMLVVNKEIPKEIRISSASGVEGVKLFITCNGSEQLNGYNFHLVWDPAIMSVSGVTSYSGFGNQVINPSTFPITGGSLRIVDFSGTKSVSGNATLFSITCSPKVYDGSSTVVGFSLVYPQLEVDEAIEGDVTSQYSYVNGTFTTPVIPVPDANYTANITSGNAPLVVRFNDLSTGNPTTWNWTFGDGLTSTDQHPVHTYTTAGTYNVSLTVANVAGGDTLFRAGYINVMEPPVVTRINVLPASSSLLTGQTREYTLALDTAPDGLSGYNLTVQLTDPAVAEIIAVRFPSWAALPANSTLPADAVWCKAADLTGASGTANITLVTVTVRADAEGTTNITVLPTRVEDRQEGRYTPTVVQAQLQATAVDDIAPEITITSPADGATVSRTIHVNATITDAGGVDSATIDVSIGGVKVVPTLVPIVNGYAVTAERENVPVGNNVPVQVYAEDITGNYASRNHYVTVAESGITITSPINGMYTHAIQPVIRADFVQVNSGTVKMFLNDVDVTTSCDVIGGATDGSITLNYGSYGALADGAYCATVNGTSALAPQQESDHVDFIKDTVAPIVRITNIVDHDGDGFPESGELLYVYYTAIDANLNDVWFGDVHNTSCVSPGRVVVSFTEGNNEQSVYASDLAGNVNWSTPVHIYNNNLAYFDEPSFGSFAGIDLTQSALYDLHSTAQAFTLNGPDAQITLPTLGAFDRSIIGSDNVTLDNRKDGQIQPGSLPSQIGIYTTPSGTLDFAVTLPNITNATLMIVKVNGTGLDNLMSNPSGSFVSPNMLQDLLDSRRMVLYGKGPAAYGYALVSIDNGGNIVIEKQVGQVMLFPGDMQHTIRGNQVNLDAGFNTATAPGLTPLAISDLGQGEYLIMAVCMDGDRFAILSAVTFEVMGEVGSLSTDAATYSIGNPIVINSAVTGDTIAALLIRDNVTYIGNVTRNVTAPGKESLESIFLVGGGNTTFREILDQTDVWISNGYGSSSMASNANTVGIPSEGLLAGTYQVYMFLENNGILTSFNQTKVTISPAPPVVANFTANVTAGAAPLTVQFTDLSTGDPISWNWTFGDGGLSTIRHPVHTYATAGNYTVSLTVTNADGSDSEVKADYIAVTNPAPTILAITPNTGYTNSNASISLSGTGFFAGATVWLAKEDASTINATQVLVVNQTTITCTFNLTGAAPGVWDVVVANPGGASATLEDGFSVDYAIRLAHGWNFISIPKRLATGSNTAMIFSHIDTAGRSVFLYNTSSGRWTAMNAASEVRPLDGIWIYSNATAFVPLTFDSGGAQTPPTKTLSEGWNAIGFSALESASARDTLISVDPKWTQLIGWNADTQLSETPIIRGSSDARFSDSRSMLPLKGYWIYMNEGGVLAALSV